MGAGVSTETNFMHSYGLDAMVGAKIALRENLAFRVDGVWDWLANEDWKTYKSIRVGFSVYRRPSHIVDVQTRTVTVASGVVAAPMVHEDSVSASETRRLRDRDAALRELRDSLRNAPVRMNPVTSAKSMETMEASIHFAFDKSLLTDSAKAILDDKITVFRANPGMTIVMVGYTDLKGSSAYNLALGGRRAQAAKDYIVGKGIARSRVLMESEGEGMQLPNTEGVAGEAVNRRAIFRLLMVPDVILEP
jgi:peptidoglycan-associated lipoprotein